MLSLEEKRKARPISFPNIEMIKNIDFKKTFRRPIRPQIMNCCQTYCMSDSFIYDKLANNLYCSECGYPQFNDDKELCPPYSINDILYVKESYAEIEGTVYYKADGNMIDAEWISPTFMTQDKARYYFKVTDIKIERLHDIIPSTSIPTLKINAEGLRNACSVRCCHKNGNCMNFMMKNDCQLKRNYISSWNASLNSAERKLFQWDRNPLVWVFEIRRIGE